MDRASGRPRDASFQRVRDCLCAFRGQLGLRSPWWRSALCRSASVDVAVRGAILPGLATDRAQMPTTSATFIGSPFVAVSYWSPICTGKWPVATPQCACNTFADWNSPRTGSRFLPCSSRPESRACRADPHHLVTVWNGGLPGSPCCSAHSMAKTVSCRFSSTYGAAGLGAVVILSRPFCQHETARPLLVFACGRLSAGDAHMVSTYPIACGLALAGQRGRHFRA